MDKLLDAVKSLKKDYFKQKDDQIEAEVTQRNNLIAKAQGNTVVENTEEAGEGKETVPVNTLLEVVELIPNYFTFMGAFAQGYQGTGLGISVKVPIVGETNIGLYNAEWKSSTGGVYPDSPLSYVATDEITINQVPIIFSIAISRRQQNYSVFDFENFVKKEFAKQAARTVEVMVMNSDDTTASTGNINSVDADPTTVLYGGALNPTLRTAAGLRKTMLAGTVNVDFLDVGVMDFDDFINVRGLMKDWSYALDDMALIMNGDTYNKALLIEEFKKYDQNGRVDNVINTGKLPPQIAGVDRYIARDYPRTLSTGKVSSTGASNTKGGYIYAKKNAVQWGYGQELEIEIVKVAGKGTLIVGTMEIGFAILNKKAGSTSPMIVGAINATI